ncbi:MAG: RidA family protein [Longimicrobiales bacterium]
MELKIVQTEKAPAAIGPYSQAIVVGSMVYTAGQIALDPATMQIVGRTIEEQTVRVFENLQAILESAGASLRSVVKTTVFLSDMGEFTAMNEVYARYFGDHKPARSTVQAARLPKDVKVEIEAVAALR